MKYMGSKSRIKKFIVPILQDCIDMNDVNTYIEPFVGGANVIDSVNAVKRKGFDKNKYLIAMFNALQKEGLQYPRRQITKEHYDLVRNAYYASERNETAMYADWYIGLIGFVGSYNGRFFDGGFAKPGIEKTTKSERYREYYVEALLNLEQQLPYLTDVEFICSDYKDIDFENIDTSVIYCDPPYQNTKRYATSKDFDYVKFWEFVRTWSKNHFVFVSEETAPTDFISVWEQNVSRSIKAESKSKAKEHLYVLKDSKAHKWFVENFVF